MEKEKELHGGSDLQSSCLNFIVIRSFQIRKMQPFRVVRLLVDEWAEASKTKCVNSHFTDNSQFVNSALWNARFCNVKNTLSLFDNMNET